MFERFELKKNENENLRIEGYLWPVKDAKYVFCIVHGTGEYSERYDRMAKYLNGREIAVISMDLRGHGRSTGKRGDCAPREAVLNNINTMLMYAKKKYQGISLVLYGHSMGGNIGLDYMKLGHRNDIPAAYIISAPWIRLVKTVVPRPLYAFVRVFAKIWPQMTISTGINSSTLGNKKVVGNYDGNPLIHKNISLRSALDGVDIGRALEAGTWESNGGADNKPLILMHGTEDRLCDIKGTIGVAVNERKRCEFIPWVGLYHEIHNGGANSCGDEVLEKIGDLITTL